MLKSLKTVFNPPNTKSISIVKMDGIGDYVLFRNYLQVLKASGFGLMLVGNESWKDLFNYLDKELIYKSIWINKTRFSVSRFYRIRKSIVIYLFNRTYYLWNLTSSRSFYFDDCISRISFATLKVAFECDFCNQTKHQASISDLYYSEIISANTNFEFFKYKVFFEKCLNRRISIELFIKKPSHQENRKSILFFIGGSEEHKKWDIENFILLGKDLFENYRKSIIICGIEGDIPNSILLETALKSKNVPCDNLCGKTKLHEMIKIINKCVFVVSNDTSMIHLSASLDIPTFCIYKGDHFGRYLPYPNDFGKEVVTISSEKELKKGNIISKSSINYVLPEQVLKTISEHIND